MAYDSTNIFAKILRGEIPADAVYENDLVLAINDIAPAAPVHVLVMPKKPYVSFDDFVTEAGVQSVTAFFQTVRKIAVETLHLGQSGYRLITNHGPDASQTVPHFHVHILGGRALGGLVPTDRLDR